MELGGMHTRHLNRPLPRRPDSEVIPTPLPPRFFCTLPSSPTSQLPEQPAHYSNNSTDPVLTKTDCSYNQYRCTDVGLPNSKRTMRHTNMWQTILLAVTLTLVIVHCSYVAFKDIGYLGRLSGKSPGRLNKIFML